MSLTRIYQPVALQTSQILRLDEKASHHLARVLRAQIGDKICVFNGEGGEYHGIISRIDKKNVEVSLQQFVAREAESSIEICLAQGIARGEKMDFIVQKAVELGVTKIIPLLTERCNVRLDSAREEKRLAHWQAVIISACEQSGRNRLPEIVAPVTLKEWLMQAKADRKFVLSPHVNTRLTSAETAAVASAALLIGPEGGLGEQEVEAACEHGFLPLNLGPRVLRTETATVAAITLLQCQYGDLRG